jgi:hypothetical protein
MPNIALGREVVLQRRTLPQPAREATQRNIPPEPDDLWDAIAIQARLTALIERMKGPITSTVAIGLMRERQKDEELLSVLLERLELDEATFEDRLQITPAVVYAIKLARLEEEEALDARKASFADDFVISIYGRGFQFMDSLVMSGEYTNAAGEARSFPMTRAGELADMTGIEFTAGARPSDLGFTVDAVVTLIATMTLPNGTEIRRAVERIVLA